MKWFWSLFSAPAAAAPAPKAKRKIGVKGPALTGAALALTLTTVTHWEGVKYRVYRDIVGVPTYCYGETKNPKWGHVYSPQECKDILIPRLQEFNDGVNSCVHVELSPSRRAASVSLAYNIGIGAFCKSTYVKALNGNWPDPCQYILRFDKAGGKTVKGLQNRRKEEAALCRKDE
jgi:lysozyme